MCRQHWMVPSSSVATMQHFIGRWILCRFYIVVLIIGGIWIYVVFFIAVLAGGFRGQLFGGVARSEGLLWGPAGPVTAAVEILPPWEGSLGSCGEDSVAGWRLIAVILTWILVHVIVIISVRQLVIIFPVVISVVSRRQVWNRFAFHSSEFIEEAAIVFLDVLDDLLKLPDLCSGRRSKFTQRIQIHV